MEAHTAKRLKILRPLFFRFTCDNQSTEIEQLEGLISGLEGEELIWLGRRNQEEVWNMEDKIIEILEISRKKQPEAFNPLEVL